MRRRVDANTDERRPHRSPLRSSAADAPDRRTRHRLELLADIGTTVCDLVVEAGPAAVTMAAVAERLGITAPALYRYVRGRGGLIDLGCGAVAQKLAEALVRYRDRLGPDPLERALGVCREFRRWSLAHRAEYGLALAHRAMRLTEADTSEGPAGDAARAAELALVWVIEEALLELWLARPFQVPDDASLPDALRTGLVDYRERLMTRAKEAGYSIEPPPLGAMSVLLEYWTRIYGLVSMEVFGHLDHAVPDGAPLFEVVLADLSRLVGRPPHYSARGSSAGTHDTGLTG